MNIEWNVPTDNNINNDGKITTITVNEGDNIDYTIRYTPNNCKCYVLSSTLPSDEISVVNYTNEGYIKLVGTAPQVSEDTSYYVTIRLSADIDGQSKISDKCFQIINKTLPLEWDKNQSTELTAIVYQGFNEELHLLHTNGNEVFKKVAGELPYGINLSSTGVLYGSINGLADDQPSEYNFTIDVFVDGKAVEPSLQKDFSLNVTFADSKTKPLWVTEPGHIGNIGFNEQANFQILAYDMSGDSTLVYELDETLGSYYKLPPGLSLSPSSGKITGILSISQYATYEFGIKAYKTYNDEKIESDTRIFSITANDVSKEHQLVWTTTDTLDLGKYIIGNAVVGYVPTPHVEDGSEIRFSLGYGDIPKGLVLNENGTFGGVLEHQEIRDCYFTIIAETKYVSVIKNVVMHLGKGLGQNAIKMYLRINNEYRKEYIDLKSQFNPNTAYKSNNSNFVVDTFPKIDIAVLTCYDKEILSQMINYGNPVIIRFKGTESLAYSQINNYGEPIENYEVIYKAIDESTYQWEDLNIGNYDFNSKLELQKENSQISEDAELEFNNPTYSNLDIIDTKRHIDYYTEEFGYNKNFDDCQVSYNVFNFQNFRDLLTQKFYVYKKDGIYYYSVGSQELFNLSTVEDTYYLYKDIITNTYKITKNLNTSKDDVEVIYENSCVYDKNDRTIYYNTLFKFCEIIIDDIKLKEIEDNRDNFGVYQCNPNNSGEYISYPLLQTQKPFIHFRGYTTHHYLQEITNPICFDRDKNNNILQLTNIPSDSELVMPMITENDIHYDDIDVNGNIRPYIRFLDTEVEQLPEWKRTKPIDWTPYTQFSTGDVIINNSIYYECLQQFRSGEKFVEDKNLLKVLTNEEVNKALSKSYFPTLDLGYYEVNTNRYYLNQVRTKEANGEYWYNRDFLFYEVVCEPLFNKNIDTFCVWFDKDKNRA